MRSHPLLLATTLFLAFLGLAVDSIAQQPTPKPLDLFEDRLDVRLVNVDVVVTDNDGHPISGLEAEDFELRVGGRPVPISNFSEIGEAQGPVEPSNGADVALSLLSAETSAIATPLESRPVVVLLVDGQSLLPITRARLLEEVKSSLPRLIESSRGVVVASLGERLVIGQTVTRDIEVIEAALDEIAGRPPTRFDDLSPLIRKIENGTPPAPGDELAMDRAEAEARSLLAEIRSTAFTERFSTTGAARQLRQLIGALGTLPGRSCVLFLSEGMVTLPAEIVYRVWWEKYKIFRNDLGIFTIESELQRNETGTDFVSVLGEAASNRVSFYVISAGEGQRGDSAFFSTTAALDAQRLAIDNPKKNLTSLASSTGGESSLTASRNGHLIDTLIQDLGHYYSLAFDPAQAPKKEGRVRVRLATGIKKARLRHVSGFRERKRGDELVEKALATLHFDVGENAHGVAVEIGQAQETKNGSFRLSILIKVPMAEITLLPEGDRHLGQLSLALVAMGKKGGTSPVLQAQVPIEIANSELLAAMGRSAGARLELLVAPGSQKIAIALRDDVAVNYSTLNLVVDPDGG